MKSRQFDTIATSIIVACAVVMTAHSIVRQPPAAPTGRFDRERIAPIPTARGNLIGSEDAPVQIVKFGDFQCPFCRVFHTYFEDMQREYPGKVALRYIHFPLGHHELAEAAAASAACAADQNRFGEMVSVLYAAQDSLAHRSWIALAEASGVEDIGRFDSCLKDPRTGEKVRLDKEFGLSLDVKATPTVVINGHRYRRTPKPDQLRQDIAALLAGKRLEDK